MIETLSDSAFAIGAMGVLLFGSAFFSSAETAVFNLSLSDLRRGRARTMRRLDALLQDRKGLLITVLIGNLVVNVLYFNLGCWSPPAWRRRGPPWPRWRRPPWS